MNFIIGKRAFLLPLILVLLQMFFIAKLSYSTLYVVDNKRITDPNMDEIVRPAWDQTSGYQSFYVSSRTSSEANSEIYKFDIVTGNSEILPNSFTNAKKEITVSDNGVVFYSMESGGSGYGKKIYQYGQSTPIIDVGQRDAGEPFYFKTLYKQLLFFATNYNDTSYNIYVYDFTGDTISEVLWKLQFTGDERAPVISPDGQWLAFKERTDSDTDWEIYIADISSYITTGNFPIKDAVEAIKLTDNDVDDEDPYFSPIINGHQYIVYTSYSPNTGKDLYIMDIMERVPYRLTSEPTDEFAPAWSDIYPDGTTKIAYLRSNDFGKNDVWVMTIKDVVKPESIINPEESLAYPNPFKIATDSQLYIRYNLLYPATVTIRIFDLSGALVREAEVNTEQPNTNGNIGRNYFIWDGSDAQGEKVSSGIYFYRIDARAETLKDKYIGKFVVIN